MLRDHISKHRHHRQHPNRHATVTGLARKLTQEPVTLPGMEPMPLMDLLIRHFSEDEQAFTWGENLASDLPAKKSLAEHFALLDEIIRSGATGVHPGDIAAVAAYRESLDADGFLIPLKTALKKIAEENTGAKVTSLHKDQAFRDVIKLLPNTFNLVKGVFLEASCAVMEKNRLANTKPSDFDVSMPPSYIEDPHSGRLLKMPSDAEIERIVAHDAEKAAELATLRLARIGRQGLGALSAAIERSLTAIVR